jgi:cytochrome bd-type quinol oxidase subunit 2
VQERTINPIYSPFKTHNAMNKTWKTILQVISYVITLLLGGAAGNVMM